MANAMSDKSNAQQMIGPEKELTQLRNDIKIVTQDQWLVTRNYSDSILLPSAKKSPVIIMAL